MTEISQVKLDEMLAGLEGVTPGPWAYHRGNKYVSGFAGTVNARQVAVKPEGSLTNKEADFAHIARCDPDTMRALIALASQALRSQGEAGNGPTLKEAAWHDRGYTLGFRHGVATGANCTADEATAALERNSALAAEARHVLTHPAPQEAGEVNARIEQAYKAGFDFAMLTRGKE